MENNIFQCPSYLANKLSFLANTIQSFARGCTRPDMDRRPEPDCVTIAVFMPARLPISVSVLPLPGDDAIGGFGKEKGSLVLTIQEAKGLMSQGTIIVRTTAKQKLHDSVSHAVVAITRHTVSCVYYTDDGEDAFYVRFMPTRHIFRNCRASTRVQGALKQPAHLVRQAAVRQCDLAYLG
ncbi:hypothetical protein EVAR_76012_1 [Eumeta japonica]|uniref:(+)RNA virus helicase C-terminal domain-containing protein n=1 Tax=Eumeta variegata TaxID=151549 RepID=A0A4C1UAG2_EUMVA|nr:hypothetical protein EVAR_76012_1 [Eumeta japonica]